MYSKMSGMKTNDTHLKTEEGLHLPKGNTIRYRIILKRNLTSSIDKHERNVEVNRIEMTSIL